MDNGDKHHHKIESSSHTFKKQESVEKRTYHKRPRELSRDDNEPSKRHKPYTNDLILSNLASRTPYPVLSNTHSDTKSMNHLQKNLNKNKRQKQGKTIMVRGLRVFIPKL